MRLAAEVPVKGLEGIEGAFREASHVIRDWELPTLLTSISHPDL